MQCAAVAQLIIVYGTADNGRQDYDKNENRVIYDWHVYSVIKILPAFQINFSFLLLAKN